MGTYYPPKQVACISTYTKESETSRSKEAFWDHLAQPTSSSSVTLSKLPRTIPSQGLNLFKNGDWVTCLTILRVKSVFWCLEHLRTAARVAISRVSLYFVCILLQCICFVSSCVGVSNINTYDWAIFSFFVLPPAISQQVTALLADSTGQWRSGEKVLQVFMPGRYLTTSFLNFSWIICLEVDIHIE